MAQNPIFNRLDKEAARGYAGFDRRGNAAGPQDLSAAQLQDLYSQPSAPNVQSRRLTMDDVVMKALGLFAIVLVTAAAAWFVSAGDATGSTGLALWMGGMFGTLALGFVIAFKKVVSVPLIVLYAVLEGAFVGAVSQFFEARWDGAVPTAVVATISVFLAMFAGYKLGFIKVTNKFRRMMGMAILGYFIFALINLGFAFAGFGGGWGAFGTGIGPLISLFAIGLAAFSLAMDFDSIDRAVRAGAPEKYSWLLAHGLIVTLVWLYIEILRLIAITRD